VIAFVRSFGSYLRLHDCLAHAAAVQAGDVISVLLELARHDPRHKELMKLGVKPNMLVFYEPVSCCTCSGLPTEFRVSALTFSVSRVR
jgi:hypothetical protein